MPESHVPLHEHHMSRRLNLWTVIGIYSVTAICSCNTAQTIHTAICSAEVVSLPLSVCANIQIKVDRGSLWLMRRLVEAHGCIR